MSHKPSVSLSNASLLCALVDTQVETTSQLTLTHDHNDRSKEDSQRCRSSVAGRSALVSVLLLMHIAQSILQSDVRMNRKRATHIEVEFADFTAARSAVHLVGSWDNYMDHLPLSEDAAVPGRWEGTFRFHKSPLKEGKRYWYFFLVDFRYLSYDFTEAWVVEETTKTVLNILDVPTVQGMDRHEVDLNGQLSLLDATTIAMGRSLSSSRIWHPRPIRPCVISQFTAKWLTQLHVETSTIACDDSEAERSAEDCEDSH